MLVAVAQGNKATDQGSQHYNKRMHKTGKDWREKLATDNHNDKACNKVITRACNRGICCLIFSLTEHDYTTS